MFVNSYHNRDGEVGVDGGCHPHQWPHNPKYVPHQIGGWQSLSVKWPKFVVDGAFLEHFFKTFEEFINEKCTFKSIFSKKMPPVGNFLYCTFTAKKIHIFLSMWHWRIFKLSVNRELNSFYDMRTKIHKLFNKIHWILNENDLYFPQSYWRKIRRLLLEKKIQYEKEPCWRRNFFRNFT